MLLQTQIKIRSGLHGWLLFLWVCVVGVLIPVLTPETAYGTPLEERLIREAPALNFYARPNSYAIENDSYDRLMVGVHVNGFGPFPFIIDTGASRSIIYRSLTAMMPLEAIPNKSRRVLTVNGYHSALVYPMKDIYALGSTLSLPETVALPDIDGSDAKGLLGVDLLAGKTLVVRPAARTASLLKNAASLNVAEWQYIQGRPVAYGSLALEVDFGGVHVPVIVDTGASDTVINSAGAKTLLRAATGIRTEKTIAVVARGKTIAREKLVLPHFDLAGKSFRNTPIYVADVPIFRLLGAADVPAIILGMNVIGQQDFAIDFKGWRLYMQIEKQAPSRPIIPSAGY